MAVQLGPLAEDPEGGLAGGIVAARLAAHMETAHTDCSGYPVEAAARHRNWTREVADGLPALAVVASRPREAVKGFAERMESARTCWMEAVR